jgi:hypothetical protein
MAKYESDMLSFAYTATLHIHHPTDSLQDVTIRLGLAPRKTHARGDPRTTPKGSPLPGTYSDHYWFADLVTEDQKDLTQFLRGLVSELEPQRDFLRKIAETGGEVCVFIGVGSSRCCAHQFDRELLSDLAATGMDLRIDFYGCDLPQRGLHGNAE